MASVQVMFPPPLIIVPSALEVAEAQPRFGPPHVVLRTMVPREHDGFVKSIQKLFPIAQMRMQMLHVLRQIFIRAHGVVAQAPIVNRILLSEISDQDDGYPSKGEIEGVDCRLAETTPLRLL